MPILQFLKKKIRKLKIEIKNKTMKENAEKNRKRRDKNLNRGNFFKN